MMPLIEALSLQPVEPLYKNLYKHLYITCQLFCFGTQCLQNTFIQIDWYFSNYVFTFLLGRELFTYLPISYFLCLELTSGYKSKLIRSLEIIRYELLKNHSKKYSENKWWQWLWLKTNTSNFQRENYVEIEK